MKISERFQDNLIASTDLNAQLVPGLNVATLKGPIAAAVGLDQIADNVTVDLAQTLDSTSHARPSMFASISSFAENVNRVLNAVDPSQPPTVYAGLSRNAKKDFAEWQGMVAVIALSNIYTGTGLNLSVDTVFLDAQTSLVHKCVLMEMDKDAVYSEAVVKDPDTDELKTGYLYYICQNGVPFAVYHPNVGLCAMKEYDGSIFDGVISWYRHSEHDCHSGWQSVMEPDGSSFLDDFCLSRIAWWARQNGLRKYEQYLHNRLRDPGYTLPDSLKSLEKIPNSANINTVWAGKGDTFGTAMMFYQDLRGNACALPALFLDTMLITYIGEEKNNRQVYITNDGEKPICFRDVPAELTGFAPVAPLRRSMVTLLKSCTLETLVFDAAMESQKLRSVTVEMQIRTGGNELFTIRKLYDSSQVRLGKLPYLMIWPYVSMPEGMDLWKQYYATWQDISGSMAFLTDVDGINLKALSDLNFDFEEQGMIHDVYRPTAQSQYWSVCTSERPFRYALVKGKADGKHLEDAGMIFVPEAKPFDTNDGKTTFPINHTPVKLAIDFGTTSTVCALRTEHIQDGRVVALPFRDYGRAITCDNADAKRVLDVEHWLGNTVGGEGWQWDKKVFSVAQLLERKDGTGPDRELMNAAGQQEYYVDGRMFLVSGSAMSNYASSAQHRDDPLLAQQIMNDMKFNESLDTRNYQAASIYLAGVYTYAVLYLLHERIFPVLNYIDLRVSYPNAVTLNALKESWRYAKQILDKVMAPILTKAVERLLDGTDKHFYNEATATTAYQRRIGSTLEHVTSGLVSLDVGGGTTDISITNNLHPGKVANLSVRYAGREIMVSSLIEYFRRFTKTAKFGLDSSFENLWEEGKAADRDGTKTLMNQFATLCKSREESVTSAFLRSLTTNSTVRMNVEMLLASGLSMGEVSNANASNLLRQLITLKFLMVLRVAAKTVKESIALWKDPKDPDKLSLTNNQMEINLSISGTSAQLLQYVFDCRMQDMNLLEDPIQVTDTVTARMAGCMNLFNVIFYEEVKDLLPDDGTTNLRIYIDADVKEKREVSFGMLQSNIDDYVAMTKNSPVASDAPAPAASSRGPKLGVTLSQPVYQKPKQDGSANEKAKRDEKIEKMKLKLSNYPQEKLLKYLYGDESSGEIGLIDYIREYEQIYFEGNAQDDRGLGSGVYAISRLFPDDLSWLKNSFAQSKNAVADARAKYMVEQEHEAYEDLLACMYLVEEIIDREMAKLQR